MADFIKGDVVVLPFPFSHFGEYKKRPALVIARSGPDDLILCQITSQTVKDSAAIPVGDSDFESGSLRQSSNVRPNRIFTVDQSIVMYLAGHLKPEKVKQVIDSIIRCISE